MQRFVLKSKIHRAKITGKELHYEGSLSLDTILMESAGLLPFERIDVYNVNNGVRFSTYVIPAPAGSGEVKLNGAASRLGEIGDLIIIASYAILDDKELFEFRPLLVYVNENNQVLEVRRDILQVNVHDR
ncbi:MAG: aspartate 1-decarboxylase [Hydrogenobacter sp.]|uniref:aspartate 1-decarboxylase n=1 Tax=Hydrogenobacter thermophilus TaxID=940 RepID=UPI0030F9F9B1